MISTSFGDMARHLTLSRQSASLKQDITTLSKEVTTGLARDKIRHVKGDVAMLAGLEQKVQAASLRKDLAQHTGVLLSTQQRVLENATAYAEKISLDVLTLGQQVQEPQISGLIKDMRSGLEETIRGFNTTFAGRGLFSGMAGDGPALASADDILSGLVADMPPGTDAATLSDFVDSWFSPGGGFDALGYIGDDAIPQPVDLGNGIEIRMDVTAEDRAIRTVLAGYAKAALLEEVPMGADTNARRNVLQQAALTLSEGKLGLIDLSARVGVKEERASTAMSRAGAEYSAFSIARAELVSVDEHRAALQLEQAMTQLDLVFSLTARLSRLTLADYLR